MLKQTREYDKLSYTETNLNAVTSATTGDSIDLTWYTNVSIMMTCSVNTGAVTVTIQGSIDGSTWKDLDTKTYTGATGSDFYHYGDNEYYAYYRTKTSTQSNSTVTTKVLARN